MSTPSPIFQYSGYPWLDLEVKPKVTDDLTKYNFLQNESKSSTVLIKHIIFLNFLSAWTIKKIVFKCEKHQSFDRIFVIYSFTIVYYVTQTFIYLRHQFYLKRKRIDLKL